MKNRVLILAFVFLALTLNTNAQEAILTTGGDASSTTGSVSYSVGQIVYTTNTGATGSVAQGVQQPYEISISTAIKNTKDILLDFKAYPNPVRDNLRLRTGNRNFDNLYYQLLDIKGNLLKQEKISDSETLINMSGFPSATYLLKVIYTKDSSSQEMKLFKIIKR